MVLTPALGLGQLWDGISDPSIVGFGKTRQQG